jgi:hypothetical protein
MEVTLSQAAQCVLNGGSFDRRRQSLSQGDGAGR